MLINVFDFLRLKNRNKRWRGRRGLNPPTHTHSCTRLRIRDGRYSAALVQSVPEQIKSDAFIAGDKYELLLLRLLITCTLCTGARVIWLSTNNTSPVVSIRFFFCYPRATIIILFSRGRTCANDFQSTRKTTRSADMLLSPPCLFSVRIISAPGPVYSVKIHR